MNSIDYTIDNLRDMFKDYARSNLYRVEFEFSGENIDIQKTELSAKSVSIPDFQIGVKTIRRMGMKIDLPATTTFPDIQMVLFCDDTYIQRQTLHTWIQNSIYDTDTNQLKPSSALDTFTTRVHQLNSKLEPIFTTEYGMCWVTSLGEIQLSQESDGISEFPITLKYSTYKVK